MIYLWRDTWTKNITPHKTMQKSIYFLGDIQHHGSKKNIPIPFRENRIPPSVKFERRKIERIRTGLNLQIIALVKMSLYEHMADLTIRTRYYHFPRASNFMGAAHEITVISWGLPLASCAEDLRCVMVSKQSSKYMFTSQFNCEWKWESKEPQDLRSGLSKMFSVQTVPSANTH